METSIMLDYLAELAANNDRDWFHAHKKERETASGQFEELVQALIYGIGAFDKSVLHNVPNELTFKLVRDTRFSHDKSPYNPTLRAHISSKGKLPIPVGYFIALRPGGGTFLGGGLFADMFSSATVMVRDAIAAKPDEWRDVISAPDFTKYFTVKGAALKNVPAGYDRENPQAEYLKFKSWYVEYFVPDAEVADADGFLQRAVDVFKAMKPFNDFLNDALKEFKMPTR